MHAQTEYRTAFQMVNWKIEPSIPHTHIHYQAIKGSMKAGASLRQQVLGFHRMYDMPVRSNPVDKLADVSNEEIALRINLVIEEVQEWLEKGFGLRVAEFMLSTPTGNCGPEMDEKMVQEIRDKINVIEIADASGDLKYVLEGADIQFGIPSVDVSREIHASNMTKLDEDGNVIRRDDGKILKGPNFMEPQLNAIINFRKEY